MFTVTCTEHLTLRFIKKQFTENWYLAYPSTFHLLVNGSWLQTTQLVIYNRNRQFNHFRMCSSTAKVLTRLLPFFQGPSLSRGSCVLTKKTALKSFLSVFPWVKMCIETLYGKSNVGSKVIFQEGKKLRVLLGHIKMKWKDGMIILTAGGISKLLIKRLTIKNMKTQVSRGLLILSWFWEDLIVRYYF